MVLETVTQDPTVMMLLTFIGVLIIGFAKFYERKTAPGGTEVWDDKKFAMFFVVAAAVMGFEYIYTGSMNFPGEEVINAMMLLLSPVFGVFGTAYTVIVGGKLLKNNVVIPVVSDIQKDTQKFAMGFTATPTYTQGKSPLPVSFKLYTTQVQSDHPGTTSIDIDWGDGTVTNVVPVKGYAEVGHVFSFEKNDKYTGHTFYPVFKINGSDGSETYFNVEGKSVEVWVQA